MPFASRARMRKSRRWRKLSSNRGRSS
uniref:Uncharacterized protein n=1 Tax=Anguilla anguilla TaxID=7936 RepID=A0A0E9RZY4_ANGAN